jgi:ferredoxin
METMTLRKKGPAIQPFPDLCAGCLICELRCSLRFEKAFNPSKARIKIRRQVGADREYEIVFDDYCDCCGICARHCPYGALVQEKKKGAA